MEFTRDGELLARFNADGSLDTTFGQSAPASGDVTANSWGTITGDDGWETLSFGGYARFFNLAVEASGKIVVAGDVPQDGCENVLMRFMADGSFDASFGSAGDDAVNFGQTELHGSLGVDASGNDLLVSAYASQTGHLTLYRFTADGIRSRP